MNTAFKVWDKSGSLAAGYPKSLASLLSNPACLPNFTDPFAEYDALTDRFMLGALTYDSNNNSAVCVAVSATGDPTAAWHVYGFSVQIANDLFDFPHATIGSDAIYVTGNQYQNGKTFVGVRIYAYDKSQMYAGLTTSPVFVDVGNNGADKLADTLTPVRGVTIAGTAYFIAADNSACPCSSVSLWKWSDPFGVSSFTLQGGVTVASYGQPPNAPQLGGHGVRGLIATNDAGNLGAFWYDGTVYGAHSVGVDPGGGTVAGVQWYQLGNVDGAPSLVQQGILATSGQYRFFPNLSIDGQGNMTMAYAYSSGSDYAGIRYTGRLASDPAGTLQSETVLKAGETTANGGRWGDYAGGAVDVDGCTVWHVEEYARSGSLWGTWVGSMRASTCGGGPTATPTITMTPTRTPTSNATSTSTNTPAATDTATLVPTNTPLPIDTSSPTPTNTPSPAPTNTPTATATSTALTDSDSDGMPDVYEEAHSCLNPLVNDAAADPDSDGLSNVQEYDLGTNPCVPDTDGDGCGDGSELGSVAAKGGQRDPTDPYDFYDVPAPALRLGYTGQALDHGIGVTTDVLALLAYSGVDSTQPDYIADYDGNGVPDGQQYDRTLSTTLGEPWRSGPPDGAIGVTTDVLAMLVQAGTLCQ